VRKQLAMPTGEVTKEVEKPQRLCPQCGTPLLPYRSRWRKIFCLACGGSTKRWAK